MPLRMLKGDMAIGDADVDIEITVDEDIHSAEIEFILISPTGASKKRDATSITTYIATYTTVTSDIDEDGDWHVYLKNKTSNREYVPQNNIIKVRPKAEDMAKWA